MFIHVYLHIKTWILIWWARWFAFEGGSINHESKIFVLGVTGTRTAMSARTVSLLGFLFFWAFTYGLYYREMVRAAKGLICLCFKL